MHKRKRRNHAGGKENADEWIDEELTEPTQPAMYSVLQCELRSGDPQAGSTVAGCVIQTTLKCDDEEVVYQAIHRPSGRAVLICLLRGEVTADGDSIIADSNREAAQIRVLAHPHIASIGTISRLPDGRIYSVSEYVPGVVLADMQVRQGRLSPQEIWEIVEPIGSALGAVHQIGALHRDFSAHSVVMSHPGDMAKPRIKVCGFGVGRLYECVSSPAGRQRMVLGSRTLSSAAPELLMGASASAKTDLYAFGTLLYRLLTGRYPFYSPDTSELVRSHLQEPVPRPSEIAAVDTAFDELIGRCLAKRPGDRPSSIATLLHELSEVISRAVAFS